MSCQQCGNYIGNDVCLNDVFDGSTVTTVPINTRKGKRYTHTVQDKYVTCARQWMLNSGQISYCCGSSDHRYALVACRDGHINCLKRLYLLDPHPNLTKYMQFASFGGDQSIIHYLYDLMKEHPDQVYEDEESEETRSILCTGLEFDE